MGTTTTTTATDYLIEVDLSCGVRARYHYERFGDAVDSGRRWVQSAIGTTYPGNWSEVMIEWYVYRVENNGGQITLEWYAVGRGDERVQLDPQRF